MNAAVKTSAERVAALRAARAELGLKRLEVYAHPEDWPEIQELARTRALWRKLSKQRAAKTAKTAKKKKVTP